MAEGWEVVGFDLERHDYGSGGYPAQLVLQDVLTILGSQFRSVDLIVGSSPCQEFSYRAMPWKRAKALGPPVLGMELFNAQFRIQREASEAKGQYIPMVVENVKGAQPWVGRARWHFGSFYLWGDVPALMPITLRTVKVDGFNFHQHEKTGQPGGSFQSAAVKNAATVGGSWFNVAHGKVIPGNQVGAPQRGDGLKQGGEWWHDPDSITRRHSSQSIGRKAASAAIAEIPLELASHIARCFLPAALDRKP